MQKKKCLSDTHYHFYVQYGLPGRKNRRRQPRQTKSTSTNWEKIVHHDHSQRSFSFLLAGL